MSRVFAAGSSEHATYDGTPPVTAAPFTVSAWARRTEAGANTFRTVIGIGDKDVTSHQWHLQMQNFFGQNVKWQAQAGGTEAAATASGTWTTNQWHHVAGVEASTTSRTAYLDGVAGTANTTSRSPSGSDRISIGKVAESAPAASEYFTGDIAEVGVWDVALTDAEIASLAKGVTPPNIRPANLVFYAPLVGKHSPEPDLVGGLSLTLSGTSASAHPRVFRKRPRSSSKPKFPANITLTPGIASLTLTARTPLAIVNNILKPGALSVTLTPRQAAVVRKTILYPGAGALTITGQGVAVLTGSSFVLTPLPASLTLSAKRATLRATIFPGNTSMAVTMQPTLAQFSVLPGFASLSLNANRANLHLRLFPPPGTISATSTASRLRTTLLPGAASLGITAYKPTVVFGFVLSPGYATLTMTPARPTLRETVFPGSGALALSLQANSLRTTVFPGRATLSLTAFTAIPRIDILTLARAFWRPLAVGEAVFSSVTLGEADYAPQALGEATYRGLTEGQAIYG